MATYAAVRFVSWNIKGLGSPVKRSRVFSHLKHLEPDLVLLQETHVQTKGQTEMPLGL